MRREEFGRRFECRAPATYDAMIEDPLLDGIVIMTPNSTHRELAIAALRAGKDVLVTKPIATSLNDAAAMIDVARDTRRILAVGHQSRRQPAVRKLKALLSDGALGVPVMIEGNTSSPTGLERDHGSWRESPVDCPGGPLLQLGIHYIDNFQYLLGNVETVFGWQRRVRGGAGAVDTTHTLFGFRDRKTGALASSYATSSTRWIRLSGTEAVATFEPGRGLMLQRSGGAFEIVVPPMSNEEIICAALAEEIADFATCVRTRAASEVDGTVGARNLAVVMAAIESAERNAPVEVDELLRLV